MESNQLMNRSIRLVLWLLLIFSVSAMSAQDPYLQQGDRFIREEALDITRMYLPHLVMGSSQAFLFKEKVAEFLIRRRDVLNSDMPASRKRYYLRRLWERESQEMADVLTRVQLQEYLRLKYEIQPLNEPAQIASLTD